MNTPHIEPPGIGDEIFMNGIKYKILHLDGYRRINGKNCAINITLKGTHSGFTAEILPLDSFHSIDEFDSFFNSLISVKTYEQGQRIIETNLQFLGLDLIKKLNVYIDDRMKANDWDKAEFARRWEVDIWKTGEDVNTEFLAHCAWDLGRFYEKRSKYFEERGYKKQAYTYRKKTIEAYEESKDAFCKIGSKHDVQQIDWFIALSYRHIGDYNQALNILKRLDIYFYEHGSNEEYHRILLELAANYEALRMLEKARETNQKLCILAKKAGLKEDFLKHLYQQAHLACTQGKLLIAEKLLHKFEKLSYDEKNTKPFAEWLKMTIASKRCDYNEMEKISTKLISILQDDQEEVARIYKEQASSFEDQGKYQDALDRYRIAQEILQSVEAFEPLGRLEMELGVLYKNMNRFGDSLDHHRMAWEIFIENNMTHELELCRKNLLTTITKVSYQTSSKNRDESLSLFTNLINQGKIDELIMEISERSDIWKR